MLFYLKIFKYLVLLLNITFKVIVVSKSISQVLAQEYNLSFKALIKLGIWNLIRPQ